MLISSHRGENTVTATTVVESSFRVATALDVFTPGGLIPVGQISKEQIRGWETGDEATCNVGDFDAATVAGVQAVCLVGWRYTSCNLSTAS